MNNPVSARKRVVVVEDEPALRENYATALTNAGYEVDTYPDRPSALNGISAELPDLVIIDVGLGNEGDGGFELCRELRASSEVLPILFLTARDSELDVISGLRLGADDYLTKDISLAHLTVRVTALIRRTAALLKESSAETALAPGLLQIDTDRIAAWWQGEHLDLTVTEFWLVHALARHPGQVKSRQQLMDAANVVLDDQTITAHVKRIRKKFVALDADFDCIQTVYGMGYRWVENAA